MVLEQIQSLMRMRRKLPMLPKRMHSWPLTDLHLAWFRYEDYLDKQITPTDLFYLEDLELARQLVDLG